MWFIFVLAWLTACSEEQSEAFTLLSVQTEPARLEALTDEILTSAVLEAESWQPLYFQQGGLVALIAVTEGDRVKKGQRLATLDLTYQQNQVAMSRLQVQSAELELEQAQHNLTQAEQVEASGGLSAEQVRDREQRVLESELNLQKNKLQLNGQRIKLNQMILYAPFDGIISEMNLGMGERVQGDVADPDNDTNARPPMAVYAPGRFTARISLPEGQALRVSTGNTVQISLLEDPLAAFEGAIDWIAPAVDRDNRTVAIRLRASISDTDPVYTRVRDGATARVAVQAGGAREVLTVPERAMVYNNDQAYLFVTDGSVAEKVEVTPERIREGRVEISSGLEAGAVVITTQVYQLKDAQPIRLFEGAGQ